MQSISPVRRRPRFPLLAPVVVLGVLVSFLATPVPAVRHTAFDPASKPFCLVDTHIPDEAYAVEEFVRTHNFSPPRGLKGKRLYADLKHQLPSLLRPFLEYDVFPPVSGQGRPSPRIVLSDKVPYASWYSPDHYDAFVLMFPLDCIPNVGSLGPPNPFSPLGRGGS